MNMKMVRNGILAFAGVILLGWFCNILAAAIPVSLIEEHIRESAVTLEQEGPFKPVIGETYYDSIADNNTDAWMLLLLDYEGEESLLQRSLGGYFKAYENTSNTDAWAFDLFISSQGENPVEQGTLTYSRYWHGWMLPLKVLLIFMNYEDIRYVSMAAIFSLILACIFLLRKRNLGYYAMAFLAAVFFMLPVTAMVSFEYSFVMYIMLISHVILLKIYKKIRDSIGIPVYFLIIGMAVCYFDFLTYPALTLGFSLITCLFLELGENVRGIKNLLNLILRSCMWGIGYAGMWVAKWVIGTLVLKTNVFTAALAQLELRTSNTDGVSEITENVISFGMTLERNLEVYRNTGFLAVGLTFLLIFVYWVIRRKSYRVVSKIVSVLPVFILTAMIPFAWCFILKNHTYIHRNFTSNVFVIVVLAFFGCLAYLQELPSFTCQAKGETQM